MTTAVIAIAIPLVLGATGIINPSVAYGQDDPKNIQLNLAHASNTATQSNDCGNYSIVQDDSNVNCANLAAQSNAIGQTQTADPNGNDGGTSIQLNKASASNSADQSNYCGNYSIAQDNSDVNCGNLADQTNLVSQFQQISHEEP
jgi:hypothetical protein